MAEPTVAEQYKANSLQAEMLLLDFKVTEYANKNIVEQFRDRKFIKNFIQIRNREITRIRNSNPETLLAEAITEHRKNREEEILGTQKAMENGEFTDNQYALDEIAEIEAELKLSDEELGLLLTQREKDQADYFLGEIAGKEANTISEPSTMDPEGM